MSTITEVPVSWVIAMSHRARAKLLKVIGESRGYYREDLNGLDYYPVSADKLAEALTITGVRHVKRPEPERYRKRVSFK